MSKPSLQPWIYPLIMACTLFIAVLLFFGICYPHHLHFQEQNQLFLFDADYVNSILSVPGGLADLAGRFLTQFFLIAWAGAAIIATLILCVFLLTYRTTPKGLFEAASLIPAATLWIYYCDENALLGPIVAVLLSLLAYWGLSAINQKVVQRIVFLISAPILYWALGPIAIITFGLYLASSIRLRDKEDIKFGAAAIFILIVMPIVAQYCVNIPLERLFLSPHYYRIVTTYPTILMIVVVAAIATPLLPTTSNNRWTAGALWIVAIILCGYTVKNKYNERSEDVMSYDFMCRYQQWNRLINTANERKPKNSLSCTAVNLALGMRGLLANHMFEYNQNGFAGILPDFERDFVSPLTTGEVYYQLGMINTAQRYVFEAQEAIPDYQKSGRCFKRLAETNLISGNYEVARKYLEALSKTIFYSDWAEEVMPLLNNEKAISEHQEYGRIRSFMPNEDYMFQSSEIPELLSRQYNANTKNQLAYEYLGCAYLLNKDLDSFVKYLEMETDFDYQHLPYMFQQAYGLWWSQNHKAGDKIPEGIDSNTIMGLNQFIGAMNKMPMNKETLYAQFGKTYWYYFITH